jgi:predicted PurR-regulated permease PerM
MRYFKSRFACAGLLVLVVMGVILATAVLVLPLFVEQLIHFFQGIPEAISGLKDSGGALRELIKKYNLEGQTDLIIGAIQNNWEEWAKNITAFLGNSIINVTGGIMFLFTTIILTFTMLIELPNWEKRYWRLVYVDDEKRQNHKKVAKKISESLSSWINGTLLIAIIYLIPITIGAAVISFTFNVTPYLILPTAFLSFICALVPMLGPIVLLILVALMFLIYNWAAGLVIALWVIICWQVIDNVVRPNVFWKKVNVSPLTLFIATIAGFMYGGLIGLILAIPLAAIIQIFAKEFFEYYHKRDKGITDEDKADEAD